MNRSKILFIVVLTFYLSNLNMAFSQQNIQTFDHNHTLFNILLDKNVHNGAVDYRCFIQSEEFANYLQSLNKVSIDEYESWTEDQKLAFWINAYNAFTIKAIIDHYPIKRSFTLTGIFYAPKNSILQIPGVWKKLQFGALGQNVTLDYIEHGILRQEFKEPRIHVAINCASKGCPDLRDEAYTAEKIQSQMNDASIKFVNDPVKGVKIDKENNRIKVSKIFKWFGQDFYRDYKNEHIRSQSQKENGSLGFIAEYIEGEDNKNYILSNDYNYSYFSYDWSLNEFKKE